MEDLPKYIHVIFGLTVIATITWSYWATKSKPFLFFVTGWALFQAILGLRGFYQDTSDLPPRLLLFGIFPTLVFMALAFLTPKGKAFIGSFDLKTLTVFHTIRIPVEIVLALLSYHGMVSVWMTYEGTNFDLFSGITAPVVAYFAFRKNSTNKKLLLAWNALCLLLLLNVVITAAFALPSPLQKIAFDQPNVAILHFPFNLLPTVVVPLVLFAHLAAFRKLAQRN